MLMYLVQAGEIVEWFVLFSPFGYSMAIRKGLPMK